MSHILIFEISHQPSFISSSCSEELMSCQSPRGTVNLRQLWISPPGFFWTIQAAWIQTANLSQYWLTIQFSRKLLFTPSTQCQVWGMEVFLSISVGKFISHLILHKGCNFSVFQLYDRILFSPSWVFSLLPQWHIK